MKSPCEHQPPARLASGFRGGRLRKQILDLVDLGGPGRQGKYHHCRVSGKRLPLPRQRPLLSQPYSEDHHSGNKILIFRRLRHWLPSEVVDRSVP